VQGGRSPEVGPLLYERVHGYKVAGVRLWESREEWRVADKLTSKNSTKRRRARDVKRQFARNGFAFRIKRRRWLWFRLATSVRFGDGWVWGGRGQIRTKDARRHVYAAARRTARRDVARG